MQEDERRFTVAGVRDLDGCTGRIDDAAGHEAHRVCADSVASVAPLRGAAKIDGDINTSCE